MSDGNLIISRELLNAEYKEPKGVKDGTEGVECAKT